MVVAVALAVVAGGTAAGLVLSDGAAARAQGPPGVIAHGEFHQLGWGTGGGASVVRERSGALVLHLDRHFHTHGAPDLWVYVGKFGSWQLAGRLQQASGRQTYPLHSVPRAGDSVIIYCSKCDRSFGSALLKKN